ncbi:MAG: DUF4340 domain-containing protein [Deltaproteobacteria bacterium]|nr:DUF4340 domain-containing protein [Deltaproteobacteria bacterium]
MKPKTLVILLIILCALAGAGALIIYIQGSGSHSEVLGTYLIEDLPANDVASIIIETPSSTVSMRKKGDVWVVEERFGYPADFSRISGLVRKLKEVKVGRRFESSEKILKRLSLKKPRDKGAGEDEKGTRIRLENEEGKPLLGILLGKNRMKGKDQKIPDGQYVMLSRGPEVYLIDTILSSFGSGPSTWLSKKPVEVDAAEVRSIRCTGPEGAPVYYRFERPGKDKGLELIEPSADGKVKRSSLNRLSNALSSLKIEDVEDPANPPDSVNGENSPVLEYRLFNGLIYRIYPGKACSGTVPCHLRIEVGYEQPEPAEEDKSKPSTTGKDASSEEKSREKSGEELALEAKELNARLSSWVFVIPQWQHNAFFTSLDQLLEKRDTEKKKTTSK